MALIRKNIDATAYLLADHLDAMLAAGEDLLRVHRGVAAVPLETERDAARAEINALHRFTDAVHALELKLAMRGLQARERTEELRKLDSRVELIAGLFIAGTTPLADAAPELGDWTGVDFNTGNEVVSYLRSRALIPADSIGLVAADRLNVTPRFLVAGRIELSALLDLAATFLDVLELFYELYDSDDQVAGAVPSDTDARRARPDSPV